ncbi:M23 family metallopeptidase [uncultured Sphingomonas sp.]|uniref:murein hydrolase activator EnvC family protein n=1 Tax=uncultured Sphingomonas sp. TaxID=158754 RepID=UPI0025D2BB9A|nr:M23 family metallopeptidase [uncultured Sphingomonas sp.]
MGVAFALMLATAAASPESRLAALERQATRQEQRLAAAQAPLIALAARIQRSALHPPAMALVDAKSAEDLVRSRALLRTLAPAIAGQTAELRRRMITTQAARAQLAQEVARRAETRARFGSVEQAALNTRLAALPTPLLQTPRAVGGPVYRLPAAGRVVLGTGDQVEGGRAQGIALATAGGAPVRAPAAGRVAYAGPFRGYGDIVLIDHGGGWATLLAGLSLATVAAREQVAQGALLGRMGREAPRLTLELRHHGRAVDVAGMAAQRG